MSVWLLRLRYAGQDHHFASESCAPEDEDGEGIPHRGTLTVSGYVEYLEAAGGFSGPCSAGVTFQLDHVELWSLIADGHHLDGARGELALWDEGTAYAARTRVLTGRLAVSELPDNGMEIEGTLTETLIEAAHDYPPADAVASLETWDTLPADEEVADLSGTPYPFPFGKLGGFVGDDGSSGNAPATPVIIVDDTGGAEIGLIAGDEVSASSVTILYDDGTTREDATFAVTHQVDGRGRRCAVVAMSGAPAGWTLDGTASLWVTSWGAGGIVSRMGTGAILGLGDLLAHLLLQRYGDQGAERVDVAAWMGVRAELNRVHVGVDLKAGDPLSHVQRLIKMAPALWVLPGPAGYRPVVLADTPAPLCRHLEVGRELQRSAGSRPAYVDITPFNKITASFAPDAEESEFRATEYLDYLRDPLAAASRARLEGEVTAEPLELDGTYDRQTVGLILREQVRMNWTKPILFSWDAPWEVAKTLRLGQRVRVTDDDFALDERPLWIIGRQTDGTADPWTVTMMGMW